MSKTRNHKGADNNPAQKDRNYKDIIAFGIYVFGGLAGFSVVIISQFETLKALFFGNATWNMLLPLILALITFSLLPLWILSAKHEIMLFNTYLYNYLPEVMLSARFASIVIPLFLLSLILLAILGATYYSIAYLLYLASDVYFRSTTTKQTIESIHRAQMKNSSNNNALYEIKTYYNRPFEFRGYVIGLCMLSAFFLSILSRQDILSKTEQVSYNQYAYYCMIIGILIGEASIWIWRSIYYGQMRKHDQMS